MTGPDDEWAALLRQALGGDARAYGAFLAAVTPVIRGIVRARGRALGEAGCEDVVQEVLLTLHVKRQTWRSDAPVRPWLYAITRHKVVDAFRARGKAVDLPIDDFAEILPSAPAADPTERRDIETMLAKLDGRAARLVRLIGLEGASAAEAGAELGLAEGAVRVALHRAFRRLAELRERHVE